MLSHSFFVEDGLIGDFAKSKIKEVIDWIEKNKNRADKLKDNLDFKKEIDYQKKVINLIDEKIIKIKLAEMITDLIPDKSYYNQVIDKEIDFLRNKKK